MPDGFVAALQQEELTRHRQQQSEAQLAEFRRAVSARVAEHQRRQAQGRPGGGGPDPPPRRRARHVTVRPRRATAAPGPARPRAAGLDAPSRLSAGSVAEWTADQTALDSEDALARACAPSPDVTLVPLATRLSLSPPDSPAPGDLPCAAVRGGGAQAASPTRDPQPALSTSPNGLPPRALSPSLERACDAVERERERLRAVARQVRSVAEQSSPVQRVEAAGPGPVGTHSPCSPPVSLQPDAGSRYATPQTPPTGSPPVQPPAAGGGDAEASRAPPAPAARPWGGPAKGKRDGAAEEAMRAELWQKVQRADVTLPPVCPCACDPWDGAAAHAHNCVFRTDAAALSRVVCGLIQSLRA